MYKIAVLLFLTTVLAKIKNPKYDYIVFESSNSVVEPKSALKREPTENAWVLSLTGDVETLKLRAATKKEVREVFSGANSRHGKVMEKNNPKKPAVVKSSAAPEQIDVNEKATITEIMRMINKFALYTHTDPDAYLAEDNDDTPSLKLYFKGVHTSLVVRAKGKQFHYIIGPPALFPEWFYEEHKTVRKDSRGVFVELPKNIKKEFLSALLHMLTMFLSFPV